MTIPYGFYNQNTGLAAAGVVAANGLFQPQTSAIVNAFVSSNGTTNLFAYVSDAAFSEDGGQVQMFFGHTF